MQALLPFFFPLPRSCFFRNRRCRSSQHYYPSSLARCHHRDHCSSPSPPIVHAVVTLLLLPSSPLAPVASLLPYHLSPLPVSSPASSSATINNTSSCCHPGHCSLDDLILAANTDGCEI
ncbi:hypothetical protein BHE74_00010977 [Ensete ventricosum]|nr:hypothetical protein BHE74_00010977 [Ensete ventricosum]